MVVELRATDSITPYDKNPRLNDGAVDAVARSIQEYGWRQPIVVDAEGVIVVGHTRWKAAKKLGIVQVPVHVAHELTPEQARAYRIADNATAARSEWDLELLPVEIAELKDLGVDLSLLGFDDDRLAEIMAPRGTDGACDPDDIPAPPAEATTRSGDLWVLGEHRLLCGDSASEQHLDALLDGAAVDLLNQDPPYNVKVEPRSNNAIAAGVSSYYQPVPQDRMHHQGFDLARHPEKAKPTTARMRAKDRPLTNDFMSDDAFAAILRSWFANAARVMKPGASFYCWGGYGNLGNYPPALADSGLYFSQAIVWDKQWPVLGRKDFLGAFEIAFYGWKEGAGHRFFGPNNIPDIWAVKKVTPQQMEHLTCKPVELAARAMQYSSKPGENVLDLFGGSGSTLIAAEQQGRRAFLMEIDPLYCDVICDRYQRFTTNPAVHAVTGAPFPKPPPARKENLR